MESAPHFSCYTMSPAGHCWLQDYGDVEVAADQTEPSPENESE